MLFPGLASADVPEDCRRRPVSSLTRLAVVPHDNSMVRSTCVVSLFQEMSSP